MKTKIHGVVGGRIGKARSGMKFARQSVSFKKLVKKHATYVSTNFRNQSFGLA